MSNSSVSTLSFATFVSNAYFGAFIIISGVLGGFLNIIVFLSLRIYRQSSSAFYLTVVSFVNIGQLLTGLLSRVLFNLVGIDWTETSPVYCKLRNYLFQACAIISPACLCLATIDQFLITSTHLPWQRWNNIKIAHYLSIGMTLLWSLYGIPNLIYYNLVGTSCSLTNIIYEKYYYDVHIPIFLCALPISCTIIFGLLAYYNIRQSSHRMVPIIRRRHEVQLTIMVLVQVIFNAFATTPSFIIRIIAYHTTPIINPLDFAQRRLFIVLTSCIYYLYYTIPFYIYICVSERFRKQLRYVLIDVHLNRCRRRRNEVVPQIELVPINEIAPQIELVYINKIRPITDVKIDHR